METGVIDKAIKVSEYQRVYWSTQLGCSTLKSLLDLDFTSFVQRKGFGTSNSTQLLFVSDANISLPISFTCM